MRAIPWPHLKSLSTPLYIRPPLSMGIYGDHDLASLMTLGRFSPTTTN